MGSREGAERAAATRIGISLDEWRRQRAAGRKWCTRCKAWHSTERFTGDRSRADGLSSSCAASRTVSADGPTRRERQTMASMDLGWCRRCRWWLPIADLRDGLCRPHRAEREREWYAEGGHVYRRGRSAARRRGVDPVPAEWREELLREPCAYCGAPATSVDHFVPITRGGKTEPGNIVPACGPCNSSKRDADPMDWIDRLDAHWYEKLCVGLLGNGAVGDLLGL